MLSESLRNMEAFTVGPLAEAYSLLPARMRSPRATLMLLAIGLQESRFLHRRQVGGPARGYLQFERYGGVAGVLRHPVTKIHAIILCAARGVLAGPQQVYDAIEHDDVLAAGLARLLLYSDRAPLPALGDEAGAWAYYLRNWRPGKPHPQTWPEMYQNALSFVLRR